MALFGRGADDARTRIWTRGSQTIVAFVHAAQKRRRALVGASVVAILLAAAGTFGVLRYLKAQAATKVIESYSALSHCLVGSLDAGDKASVRLRAIQLSAVTQADVKRVPAKGEPWPDRCQTHAHALAESLEASTVVDKEEGQKLLAATKELAEALDGADAYHSDLSDPVDATFDSARKLGLALTDTPNVPEPEAPTEALTLDGLTSSTPITSESVDLSRLRLEPARAETAHLLIDTRGEGKAPKLCRVTAESSECREVPAPATESDRLELRATADDGASALIFAAKSGAVFRPGGDAVLVEGGVAGHEAADGTTQVVTEDDGRMQLHRFEGDDTRRQAVTMPFGLEVASPADDVQMLWRHLAAVGRKGDDRLLVASRLDGTRLPPLKEIASMTADEVTGELGLDGCRGSKATVLRMGDATAARLSFWLGERWTEAVPAELGAGVERPGVLTCYGTEAAITRYEPTRSDTELDATVAQQRCTPRECQGARVKMTDFLTGEIGLAPQALIEAVGLESKLLVVWAAGQRGGLRMRLAPIGEIARAPDAVIFDDLVAAGQVRKSSTLVDVKLIPAERFVVVLLNTTAGLYGLRVEANGKVEPLSFAPR